MTYLDSETEGFVMDDLGNRTGIQTLRGGGTDDYSVDSLTNRYTAIDASPLAYDDAGNLTRDKDGYVYGYDYENRIVEIRNSGDVLTAQVDYDTQGRRIRVYDAAAGTTTLYYYSDNWQVLQEHNGTSFTAYYVFGNYIDEVVLMHRSSADKYYLHDHLYSPVALSNSAGSVIERYEYDAYGKATVFTNMADWDTASPTTQDYSTYDNSYLFTGRRLDVLDGGRLDKYHLRNRDLNSYMAVFYQHDPLGAIDGLNLYSYVQSNPLTSVDPFGLTGIFPPLFLDSISKAALKLQLGDAETVSEPYFLFCGGSCWRSWRILTKQSYGYSSAFDWTQALGWWLVGDGEPLWFNHRSSFSKRVANSPDFAPVSDGVRVDLEFEARRQAKTLSGNNCTTFEFSKTGLEYGFGGKDIGLWPVLGRGRNDGYSQFSYSASCCVKKDCCNNGKAKISWKCLTKFRLNDKYTFDESPVLGWLPGKKGRNYWIHVRFYEVMKGGGNVSCE